MAKSRHVHKFKRVEWGKNKTIVLRCMLPGCSSYVHEEMAENRKSICWKCGSPFTLDKYAVKRTFPKCANCIKRKEAPNGDFVDNLLKDLTP